MRAKIQNILWVYSSNVFVISYFCLRYSYPIKVIRLLAGCEDFIS